MAQIASLLAVATIFIGLWTRIFTFYSQGGGGLIRETKPPMLELELKLQGGYARILAGFYGNNENKHCSMLPRELKNRSLNVSSQSSIFRD